jgi:hypothetical protein
MFPPARGRIEARVNFNDEQWVATDNSMPYTHRVNGRREWSSVEGQLVSPVGEPVLWRFDFVSSEHFVPGSIRVESGVVASQSTHSIVFRLSGTSADIVRFQYRLVRAQKW